MKWILIAGSWRVINNTVIRDVSSCVDEILERGDGIVTGGALGVDLCAMQHVLVRQEVARLKIYLPTALSVYEAHYMAQAENGVITNNQVHELFEALNQIRNKRPDALVELGSAVVNQAAYYKRIDRMIRESDELIAFHINQSAGTQYTIDQAEKHNLSVTVTRYEIA